MNRDLSSRIYSRLFRYGERLGLSQRLSVNLSARVAGVSFRVPVIQGIGMGNIAMSDHWFIELLAALAPQWPGTFMDVGANVGQTLLKLRSCSPDRPWIGFEPNPTCVMYLERLIAANRFAGCTLVPAGLFAEPGIMELDCFQDEAADKTASLVANFRPNEKVLRRKWVPVVDFAAVRRAGISDAIGIVKIDVEGGEKEVLASLHTVLDSYRPLVMLEILPVYNATNRERLARQQAVERQLHGLGYVLNRVEKSSEDHCVGLRPIAEIGIHDQLTWSDYLVVPGERQDEVLKRMGKVGD